MLIIDGQTYNIGIASLKRKAEFLDKYANRTERGNLERELIGVYYNYELTLAATTNLTEYARLWDKLTEAEEFHTVTVPGISGTYTFTAYFANISDEAYRVTGGNGYFENLTVNFIAKSPARS